MKLRYLLIIFSIIFSIISEVIFPQSYFVKHYSEEDGLPDQKTYSTCQDTLGRMWFATKGGITLYDGYSWQLFNSTNSSLQNDCIKTKLDKEGNIWVLGREQNISVSFFNGNVWESLPGSKLFGSNRIWTTDFDIIRNGNSISIAVGTKENGLYLYTNNEWHHLNISNGLQSSIVYAVTAVEDKFYIGTSNGLSIIDGTSIDNSYHSKFNIPRNKIVAIAYISPRTYLLYPKKVGYIENDVYHPVNIPFSLVSIDLNILASEDFNYILPVTSNQIIIGGLYNKYLLDQNKLSAITLDQKKGLNEVGATSAFKDREGNIWFTGLRGIDKIPSLRFRNYSHIEGLNDDEVTSIVEMAPNSYALGQLSRISFLKDGKISFIRIANADPKNPQNFRVLDLCLDKNDNLWFAFSNEGFGKVTPDNKIKMYDGLDLRKERATSIEKDNLGNLYALTERSLYQVKAGDFQKLSFEQKYFHARFRKLFFSPNNDLFIATMNNGIMYRDKTGKWNTIISSGNSKANNVYSIYFDTNKIFVGSSDGLYVVDSHTLKKFVDADFYLDRPVYFITKDHDSNYWFGTNSGVVKWDGKIHFHYSKNHGLLGTETNRDAGYVGSNGDVLIGTNKGLSIYSDECDLFNPKEKPKVIITLFEARDKENSPLEDVEIDFDHNFLTFHFNAYTFIDEENIEYLVQLEGFDTKWFSPGKSSEPYVRYTNISPGEYRFKVKAQNSLGIWSDVVSTGRITILNPFYLRWWFFILVPGFTVLLIYFFSILYKRAQYTEKLEGVVIERSKELIASKKRYEQMFNANQAIMLLIDTDMCMILDANPSAINYYGLEPGNLGAIDFRSIDNTFHFEIQSSESNNDEIRKYYTSHHKVADGTYKSVEVYLNSLQIDEHKLFYAIIHDITERKLAEEALIESEEKYRLLVDHMHDGVIVIQKRKILFVNNAISKIVGYSSDELMDVDFLQLVAAEDKDRVLSIYSSRLQREDIPSQYDIKVAHKDGLEDVYVNIRAGIFNYGGKLATIASIQDISHKKKQEETLKQLYTAVDQSPSAVIITDKDGIIEYVNPRCSEMTGYFNEELVGAKPNILKSENFSSVAYKELWATITLGRVWRGDLLNKRKDGTYFWVNATISPIKDNKGKITHYLALENDITFEKFAREEIEKNEKLLNSIVSNLPVIFFVLDKNGSINLVKGRYLATAGIAAENLLGQHVLTYFDGYSDIKADVELALKGEEFTRNVVFYGVQFEVSFAPLYDEYNNLKGTMGIAYDLTERYEVEKALKRAKEEAEKSDRLKSDFLAQMSHEIRTPINSILSFSSLLKEELYKNAPDQLKESFQIIERGGRRLIRTIDLILNMSQIQTGTYQPKFSSIDMDADVLAPVISELKSIAEGKNIKLTYLVETNDARINGDSYTLGQIFINLVDNAIKYTKKGSVTISLLEEDGKVLVKIKDTGEGITKGFIPKLFSPFAQEETGYSRRFEGTGLGLALVKNYVEINNAVINVESKKGRGTTFTVVFKKSKS